MNSTQMPPNCHIWIRLVYVLSLAVSSNQLSKEIKEAGQINVSLLAFLHSPVIQELERPDLDMSNSGLNIHVL